MCPPKGVAHHGYRGAAVVVFGQIEPPSALHGGSQQIQEIGGSQGDRGAFGTIAGDHGDLARFNSGHIIEDGVVDAIVLVVGDAQGKAGETQLEQLVPDDDQAAGVAIRHLPEQRRVRQREYRGDGADPHRGAENRQPQKGGRSEERAAGIAEIQEQIQHVVSPKLCLDSANAWHNRANAMRKGIFVTIAAVTLAGCAHRKHNRAVVLPPPVTPSKRAHPGGKRPARAPAELEPGWTETGLASWYGHPYHGRPAANGEIYDMEKLTAAHRTLPFDTWVHVVNITNKKAVDVRITDRGPFIDGRVIDLSHAAARAIDLIGPGVAPVRIELIQAPASTPAAEFAVQVGSFRDRRNAERIRVAMAARYGSARLVLRQGNPEMWRVLVGAEPTEAGATVLSDRIRRESGEKRAFVVRLDS